MREISLVAHPASLLVNPLMNSSSLPVGLPSLTMRGKKMVCSPVGVWGETAVRETREETGLEVVVRQLVGVFTRRPGGCNGPHTMVAVVHLCDVVGGELTLSHEGLALRYWPIDAVPIWHATHEQYARAAYERWQSETLLSAISN